MIWAIKVIYGVFLYCYRTYYFYEFGRDEQHIALVAAVNSGKVYHLGSCSFPMALRFFFSGCVQQQAVYTRISKVNKYNNFLTKRQIETSIHL